MIEIGEGIHHDGMVLSLVEVVTIGVRGVILPKICMAKQRGLVE